MDGREGEDSLGRLPHVPTQPIIFGVLVLRPKTLVYLCLPLVSVSLHLLSLFLTSL